MKIIDIFHETYLALSVNKARSFLTILGIVIGIASVIAMVGIGQGTRDTIESSIESLGSNLLSVTPGNQASFGSMVRSSRGSATTLTEDDADALRELTYAAHVAPEYSSNFQVVAKGTNTNTSVIGTTSDYQSVRALTVASGIFITDQHTQNKSRVAVIGPTTRDDLFGENADVVGERIRINSITFTIIGVTESKGGTGFNNQDDRIMVPLSTMQQFLVGNDYVTSISVEAADQGAMSILEEDIISLLLRRHDIANQDDADFSVTNQADIVSAIGETSQAFTTLLAAVASISLVVGGIGIMNMMLTTVTERTREIGLRKAIGARRRDISIQFLAESITLTFLGGGIGVLCGWIIGFIVSSVSDTAIHITIPSILLAFGVSAGIGIVFGYYPARRAASLNPIQALRYE